MFPGMVYACGHTCHHTYVRTICRISSLFQSLCGFWDGTQITSCGLNEGKCVEKTLGSNWWSFLRSYRTFRRWGWFGVGFKVLSILVPLPVHLLPPACWCDRLASYCCCCAFSLRMDCIPSGIVSQNKPFLHKVLVVRVLCHRINPFFIKCSLSEYSVREPENIQAWPASVSVSWAVFLTSRRQHILFKMWNL